MSGKYYNLYGMKTILTILMLCGVCCSYAQDRPPHAASDQTWVFGNQTWSDIIQMPGCNKVTFEISDDSPQCRSRRTILGETRYYYNWKYVSLHKEAIRVVSHMPKWRPGFHEGKPVSVKFMTTIVFSMKQR
jgi:hypothetical protein